ncbi:MAG TPA: hypothetical protein VHN79_09360, partial [Lacunisphaera sp.]|nr:hypothetical protein [Lacunisphaera sp.]
MSVSLSVLRPCCLLVTCLAGLLAAVSGRAQPGDRPNDDPQVLSKIALEMPLAAVLSPEEALKRFRL